MSQKMDVPKSYVAYKAYETIVIDGLATETSWGSASFTDYFMDIEGKKKPRYSTRAKLLWDDTYLYIYAKMEELHIWGNLKQRDTVIFYNNDFEVFIDPDGDTHNYYELEVNGLNTQWDLMLTKPYRNGGKAIDSWDIQGLKTAISIDGTLNDPSDKDVAWSIEIAIPWSVLTEAANHNNVPVGEFWRINFSRVNWDFDLMDGFYSRKKGPNGNFLPEYNWVWSPQQVINMHEPERWGYVFFSDIGPNDSVTFEIPVDETVKWSMYELYRRKFADFGFKLPSYIEIKGNKINVFIEEHVSGWNLWCKSPFSGAILKIREDGKFISTKK